MASVYISCPTSVNEDFLDDVYNLIEEELDIRAYCWERTTLYSDWEERKIKECVGFVLITPNNEFQIPLNKIPKGSMKELTIARESGSDIFLAYKAKDGIHIYPVEITNGVFSGIANSSNRDLAIYKKENTVTDNSCNKSWHTSSSTNLSTVTIADSNICSTMTTERIPCGDTPKSYEVRLLLLLK